ncbi:hypothetical protein L211DRAFT_844973 [Terfezia boudieri ATCC MYA-4762]|uniref:Uncharacterized protein n=1 Tax=Terfezia boudieri ATCC MYA-4762 TaxID=1051890 RepID=A0A3N4M187_9PEZI|nr:hypothetical protein L211DRAFT_844973 [Terfezia boudieri ATCC MYA-4762]
MTATTIIVPIHPDDQSHDLRAPNIPKKRFKCHLFRPSPTQPTPPNPARTHPPPPSPQNNTSTPSLPTTGAEYPTPVHAATSPNPGGWPYTDMSSTSRRNSSLRAALTPESRRWGSISVISVGSDLRPQECWDADNGMRVCERAFRQGEEGGYLSSEKVWGKGDGRWDVLVDEVVGRWEGQGEEEKGIGEGSGWELFDEVGSEAGELVDVDWDGILSPSSSGEVEIDGDADERGTVASEWTECGTEF